MRFSLLRVRVCLTIHIISWVSMRHRFDLSCNKKEKCHVYRGLDAALFPSPWKCLDLMDGEAAGGYDNKLYTDQLLKPRRMGVGMRGYKL